LMIELMKMYLVKISKEDTKAYDPNVKTKRADVSDHDYKLEELKYHINLCKEFGEWISSWEHFGHVN